MRSELLISREGPETRVALLEDGRLVELRVEYYGDRSLVGNIYKGRVDSVLPGMQAAFVDIGVGRNGFLEMDKPPHEGDSSDPTSQRAAEKNRPLKAGQEILVQVTRDGTGLKGPRLSCALALAGRYLVYLPLGRGVGVSRRLPSTERDRLRKLCLGFALESGGVIVRTAAQGSDFEALGRDLEFLLRVWRQVERRAAEASAPALIYAEADLPVRAVRDLPVPQPAAVLVDDPGLFRRLRSYLEGVAPELCQRLTLWEGRLGLFASFRLDDALRRALSRRVDLPSGGYIVIDHTEALTVVDVNTGSYVGHKSPDHTVLKTNIEACREVARQLRLRDIGGIVVVDFIDLRLPEAREAVLRTLREELERDSSKAYVIGVSPLGLVEITRENTERELRECVTTCCPHCKGTGRVLSLRTAVATVKRKIRNLALTGATAEPSSALPPARVSGRLLLRVKVHPKVAAMLAKEQAWFGELQDSYGCTVVIEEADLEADLSLVEVVN
ncbi:MAG: Rne/Rng family ribonuclease [Thermoleophilia bacterium]|nr:Rne/Rng family ribonuclease [Thermoleophilia bacterium]